MFMLKKNKIFKIKKKNNILYSIYINLIILSYYLLKLKEKITDNIL
jgi:hypothetical protein